MAFQDLSKRLAAFTFQTRMALTSPIHRARFRDDARHGRAPMPVSFYHRVADVHPNGWTISRGEFERHLDYCQENFQIVSLSEIQQRVRSGQSSSAVMAITFDDGYAENCDFALPMLIERGIPCTYFVTTDNVQSGRSFEHDLKLGVRLPINTVEQIRAIADSGIEVGCHTRSHIDFSKVHDAAIVREEIHVAKDELEQMTGKPVRYFAFPFGLPRQLTQAAIEAVADAGFDGFCSAFGAYNLVHRDWFHIRRFHGDPEFCRLQNWLSIDRRKIRLEPEVKYFLPPANSFRETFPVIARPKLVLAS